MILTFLVLDQLQTLTVHSSLDGTLIDTVARPNGAVRYNTNPVVVGDFDNDDSFQQNFEGEISDVRLWSTARAEKRN